MPTPFHRLAALLLLCAAGIASQAACSGAGAQPETPPVTGYLVGGTVTNLLHTGLVLMLSTQRPAQLVERTELSIEPGAISFVFPRRVESEASYMVDVETNPADQECAVLKPAGVVNSGHVLNLGVSCSVTVQVTTTGVMNAFRRWHTATRLNDGKVLVAGGYDDRTNSALSTAELYDPAAGGFAPTGSMLAARHWHSATLLADGRVLVAGGSDSVQLDVRGAEIYDPATGAFVPAGEMAVPRSFHSATRLANGKVLLAGGHNRAGYTRTAELYDPSTGTFSATGSMVAPSYLPTATLLEDGHVLIAGGNGTEVAELYDPATGEFTLTGSMMVPRAAPAATLLRDGTVLMTGGLDPADDPIDTAEIYDPGTGTFTMTAPMFDTHVGHSATVLPSGVVLVAGGWFGHGRDTTEIYDPSHKTFLFALPKLRADSVAVPLADGQVLFTGGYGITDSIWGSLAEGDLLAVGPYVIPGPGE